VFAAVDTGEEDTRASEFDGEGGGAVMGHKIRGVKGYGLL